MGAAGRSGHFRIVFMGYRIAKSAAGDSFATANPAPELEDAYDEDEMAYFQADISWINLGANGAPREAALTAMITGDVRGLRKRPGPVESRSTGAGRLPLCLGTYALVAGRNAVAIGNLSLPGCLRSDTRTERDWMVVDTGASANAGMPESARHSQSLRTPEACLFDLPLARPNRSRILYITYETALGLASLDQGLGRGVFPFAYRDKPDPDRETTLYFRVNRL